MDTKRPTMGSACRYSLSDPEPAYPYFYRLRRLRRRSRRRLLSIFPFGLHHTAFCSLPVRSTKELCKGCLKHFQRPLFGASKVRHGFRGRPSHRGTLGALGSPGKNRRHAGFDQGGPTSINKHFHGGLLLHIISAFLKSRGKRFQLAKTVPSDKHPRPLMQVVFSL